MNTNFKHKSTEKSEKSFYRNVFRGSTLSPAADALLSRRISRHKLPLFSTAIVDCDVNSREVWRYAWLHRLQGHDDAANKHVTLQLGTNRWPACRLPMWQNAGNVRTGHDVSMTSSKQLVSHPELKQAHFAYQALCQCMSTPWWERAIPCKPCTSCLSLPQEWATFTCDVLIRSNKCLSSTAIVAGVDWSVPTQMACDVYKYKAVTMAVATAPGVVTGTKISVYYMAIWNKRYVIVSFPEEKYCIFTTRLSGFATATNNDSAEDAKRCLIQLQRFPFHINKCFSFQQSNERSRNHNRDKYSNRKLLSPVTLVAHCDV